MKNTISTEKISIKGGKARLVAFVMTFGKQILVFQPDLIALAWIFTAAGLSVSNWNGNNDFFWITGWDLQTASLFLGITLLLAGANLLAQYDNHTQGQKSVYAHIEIPAPLIEYTPRLAPALIIVGYAMLIAGGLLSAIAGFLATLVLWLLYGKNTILWRDNKAVQFSLHMLAGLFFFAIGWGRGGAPIPTMLLLVIPYALIISTLSLVVVFALGEAAQPTKRVGQLIVGVCAALLVAAVSLAYSLGDPLGSTAPALMLPFYVVALIRGQRIDILRCFRYSLLVITIFTGARYPYLFLPIMTVFYLSRFYYHHLRGTVYPTLEGPEWFNVAADSAAQDS